MQNVVVIYYLFSFCSVITDINHHIVRGVTVPHSHINRRPEIRTLRFMDRVRYRCMNEVTSLQVIYDEETAM